MINTAHSEHIPSSQKHMNAHQFCRESDMDAVVLFFTPLDLSLLSRQSVGECHKKTNSLGAQKKAQPILCCGDVEIYYS